MRKLRGTYGLLIMFRDHSDLLIAARCGSPLVVGVGRNEQFIASDTSPLVGFTERIIYLADHQMAVIRPDNIQVLHRDHGRSSTRDSAAEPVSQDVSLEGFAHYMLKEIYEQPQSIRNALRGRLDKDNATAKFGGLNLTTQQLRSVQRIILTGCGTSWHSALVGEYLLEELARIPVEVEYASELRYRNPPVDHDTIVFGITQSGETADTLAALREMKRKGHHTLAINNVIGSSIAQEADGGVYLHAGPEIGVASTKAFTSQLTVLWMLALYFGRLRHLSFEAGLRIISQLEALPRMVEKTLECHAQVKAIAAQYQDATNFLYLGRQLQFPDRPRRRTETEGNQLHSCRRLSRRRDETRTDRACRRTYTLRVHRAARYRLRQSSEQPTRSQGSRWAGDCNCRSHRSTSHQVWPMRSFKSRKSKTSCNRSLLPFRCNCCRMKLHSCAGATSTSLET